MRFGTACAPAAFLERFIDVRARHLQRGQHGKGQRAEYSDAESEKDDGNVNLRLFETWHVPRTEETQEGDPPPRQQKPGCGAY